MILVRVEFDGGKFAHLNLNLITSVHPAPDSYCVDGPTTLVTMACHSAWIVPGTVEEVLKKLGFSACDCHNSEEHK
jgi:hypothetical protein